MKIFFSLKGKLLAIVLITMGFSALNAAQKIPMSASEKKTDVMRRVLIIDFVNQKKIEDSEYLSPSIAEAFVDPLHATNSFEVLSRSLSGKLVLEKKIVPEKLFSDESAVILGKAADADVVLIGNYIIIGEAIQIQAKAIDVHTGRVKVSKMSSGKLDSTIFALIQNLASKMSADMKRQLPPLSQREILSERRGLNDDGKKDANESSKPTSRNMVFHLAGSYNIPYKGVRDFYDTVFGGKIDGSDQWLWSWFYPYFQAGYIKATGKYTTYDTQFGFAQGGLSYPLRLGSTFEMRPYIVVGVSLGKLTSFFTNASVDTGLIVDWFFSKTFGITVSTSYTAILDKAFTLYFFNIYGGAAMRF